MNGSIEMRSASGVNEVMMISEAAFPVADVSDYMNSNWKTFSLISINQFRTGTKFSQYACLVPVYNVRPMVLNTSLSTEAYQIICVDEYHKEKLNYNLSELDEFASYKENWNLYGASQISKTLIESVKRIIIGLEYQPRLQPMSDGSIAFYYLEDNHDYLEFEFKLDGRIEMFYFSGDRKKSLKEEIRDCEINEKVGRLKSGNFC